MRLALRCKRSVFKSPPPLSWTDKWLQQRSCGCVWIGCPSLRHFTGVSTWKKRDVRAQSASNSRIKLLWKSEASRATKKNHKRVVCVCCVWFSAKRSSSSFELSLSPWVSKCQWPAEGLFCLSVISKPNSSCQNIASKTNATTHQRRVDTNYTQWITLINLLITARISIHINSFNAHWKCTSPPVESSYTVTFWRSKQAVIFTLAPANHSQRLAMENEPGLSVLKWSNPPPKKKIPLSNLHHHHHHHHQIYYKSTVHIKIWSLVRHAKMTKCSYPGGLEVLSN